MANNPQAATRLHGGRALAAALGGEAVLMLVAIPFYSTMAQADATALLSLVIPPASLVAFAGAGYWSARPVPGSGPMQGALAGVIAVALYLLLGVVASQVVEGTSVTDGFTPAYLAAHALKLAGAAGGGWYAARVAAGRDARSRPGEGSG